MNIFLATQSTCNFFVCEKSVCHATSIGDRWIEYTYVINAHTELFQVLVHEISFSGVCACMLISLFNASRANKGVWLQNCLSSTAGEIKQLDFCVCKYVYYYYYVIMIIRQIYEFYMCSILLLVLLWSSTMFYCC